MEKKELSSILLFLWCVCNLFLCSFSWKESAWIGGQGREFDYFTLALQWPATICSRTRHCCQSNGCCRSEPLSWFTIHGLWPDNDDGTWPACCTRTSFDMEKILPLKPMLEKYWPSLYCSSSSTCFHGKGPFWAHEWEKHGTCSYPVTHDEYDYFSTVLDLYNKHNVMKMLENAGIQALNGEKYALKDIFDAIEYAFGASPLLVCKHGSVQEVRLCFYKDFKPRDCIIRTAVAEENRRSCPRHISFPTYEPIVFGNATGKITTTSSDEMAASVAAA